MIEPLRTDRNAMVLTLKWAGRVDEKDISDAAREWAETDQAVTAMPENKGELTAALEMAFEAGRMYQSLASSACDDEGCPHYEIRHGHGRVVHCPRCDWIMSGRLDPACGGIATNGYAVVDCECVPKQHLPECGMIGSISLLRITIPVGRCCNHCEGSCIGGKP